MTMSADQEKAHSSGLTWIDRVKNYFRWYNLSLLLAISASIVLVSTTFAQEDQPAWYQNLDCNPDWQKYEGLEYCTSALHYDNGDEHIIHVIVIDLNNPDLRIEYVISTGVDGDGVEGYGVDGDGVTGECRDVNRSTKYLEPPRGPGCNDSSNINLFPVMSIVQAAERWIDDDLAVVINSDYGAQEPMHDSEDRDHGPEGLTVIRGIRIDGRTPMGDGDDNAVKRPWLAISETSPLRAEIHILSSDEGSKPYDWIYTGVGGGPWLIQNGEILPGEIKSCRNTPGSCYDGASQVAVGITEDSRWLFFVLGEESDKEPERTLKLLDLAEFMNSKLSAWQAIKFDGGGSSQLWYGGVSGDTIEEKVITDGDGRQLSQYLAVIALPGSGILIHDQEDDGKDDGEDDGNDNLGFFERSWQYIMGFWDKLRTSIGEWWLEQKQEILANLELWLEEQKRKLVESLEKQAEQLFSEICGCATMPSMILGFIWLIRGTKKKI